MGHTMSLADVSAVVSVIALGLSLFTLWFSVLRRGSVRSTHPSFVAIRYDFVGKAVPQAKIFFRALLFSTGKRGLVIENLFLRVTEGERRAEFSFWGYGDDKLARGSGLFVSETGVVTNHHFNPIDAEELFRFSGGVYSIELMASLVGSGRLVSLWKIVLKVPADVFDPTITASKALFYSWSPQTHAYVMAVEDRFGPSSRFADPADFQNDMQR